MVTIPPPFPWNGSQYMYTHKQDISHHATAHDTTLQRVQKPHSMTQPAKRATNPSTPQLAKQPKVATRQIKQATNRPFNRLGSVCGMLCRVLSSAVLCHVMSIWAVWYYMLLYCCVSHDVVSSPSGVLTPFSWGIARMPLEQQTRTQHTTAHSKPPQHTTPQHIKPHHSI